MVWISQLAGAYALSLMSSASAVTTPEPATAAASQLPALWAGHQVTFGRRHVPFKGEVETRMDTFVLARMRSDGGLIELDQTACHVRFSKVAGVMVHMNAEALPESHMVFATNDDTGQLVGRSLVAWANEDIDDDGHPGMTIHVKAPVCSGDLYVSNRSNTKATATIGPDRLEGSAKVHVRQEILGTEGACLGVVAKATDERVAGPFAYVPVPAGTTCETLFRQGWPVTAK